MKNARITMEISLAKLPFFCLAGIQKNPYNIL